MTNMLTGVNSLITEAQSISCKWIDGIAAAGRVTANILLIAAHR